jgi:iron(III) transport system ATP-binding protein
VIQQTRCPPLLPVGGPGLLVEGLRHQYASGKQKGFALQDVALTIPQGQVHCLLGPSGSGKSTVLRLIAGLERPQSGRIGLGRRVLSSEDEFIAPERRSIGLMFQDVALFPHMTVAKNVAFGLRSGDTRSRERRVADLLALVDLVGHAEKYPHELSGGEQQRAALARALAAGPQAVLLDEAFSALDPSLRGEVRAAVLGILRDAGIPVLMVTHDPDEAIAEADRIHVIEAGRITQSGTVAELYRAPATRFVAGFFGPVLRFSGRPEKGHLATPIGAIPIQSGGRDAVEVVIRTRDLTPVALEGSPWKGARLGDIHVPDGVGHHVGGEIGLSFAPDALFVFPRPAVLNDSKKVGISG